MEFKLDKEGKFIKNLEKLTEEEIDQFFQLLKKHKKLFFSNKRKPDTTKLIKDGYKQLDIPPDHKLYRIKYYLDHENNVILRELERPTLSKSV